MNFILPPVGKPAIPTPHFPTRQQAFLFRASEFFSAEKMAEILKTEPTKIQNALEQMGLPSGNPDPQWREKGYITIIKQMWHLLPYEQLLNLLELSAEDLAVLLREEDFFDIKLGNEKPDCEPIRWRELSREELLETAKIAEIMKDVPLGGKKPFDFEYTVPKIRFSGKEQFESRIIYGFSGLYLHAFDVDTRTYCPDEMLAAYQKLGINGLWTQGVLYQLTECPLAPEISKGWQDRQARLQELVERCSKYGIKVYLYLNEPRSMPLSFYEKHPELKGHQRTEDKICLCTSTTEVQDYLTNNVESLCRAVPGLGGFFTITRSENPTNCYSHSTPETCTCPRCKTKPMGEVIGNVLACIEKGAHRADPSIRILCWSWAWKEFDKEIIPYLPKNITLMCKSEDRVPFTIGGVTEVIGDYSLGHIGPGEYAKNQWAIARENGLKVGAKLQLNTSWECSTVPAVPVFTSIERQMKDLQKEGIRDLLLNWTLGGYPSMNLAVAAKHFYEHCDLTPLNENWQKAAEKFSQAMTLFPSCNRSLYSGPQNAGPSTLLYDQPTGYDATMTCFVYDDLEHWRANYPKDVYTEQFEKICGLWEEGLRLIEAEEEDENKQMAVATYCLFRSSLNQIRFVQARDGKDTPKMTHFAKEELKMAKLMLEQMNQNASIGFEAANHYYFSKRMLAEKILNCNYILRRG